MGDDAARNQPPAVNKYERRRRMRHVFVGTHARASRFKLPQSVPI
jgi:hypothetical protein